MYKSILLVTLVGLALSVSGGPTRTVDLEPAELTLTSVQDSSTYHVYSYSLSNPTSSTWGLLGVTLDISRSSGSPSMLAATGKIYDYSGGAPRADVGPISPSGWQAILDSDGGITWTPGYTAVISFDSIAVGDTLSGFGLRSPFLPGIQTLEALPTPEACCQATVEIEGTSWGVLPDARTVSGVSVAPHFLPSEVDIDLLQAQLSRVCGDLRWIEDDALCARLEERVGDALAHVVVGDSEQAVGSLTHLGAEINGARSRMHSNAYWLLRLNVEQARENLMRVPGG